MADFRLNRRLNNRGRTQQAVQDAIRWRRRRALLDDTGVSYAYSTDLALWYNWTTAPNGVLSLAAQTNRNDDSSFGPTLSLTRATTASVTDYNNIIKQVASGEERYTGGRRVENLRDESETVSNFPSLTNVTVTDAQETINGISLSKITDDATDARHHAAEYNWLLPENGNQHTLSAYVKGGTARYVTIGFRSATDESIFDTQTGAWDAEDAAYTAHHVQDLGNGYYRIGVTHSDYLAAYDDTIVGLCVTSGTPSYVGSGSTVFIGGVQLENVSGQDDPAPSEYQATTTAAVSKWYATKRRTNLAPSSEDIRDATDAWLTSTTGTGSLVENGDGSFTATVAASADRAWMYQSVVTIPGKTYTLSCNVTANSDGWNQNNIALTLPSTGETLTGTGRKSVTFTANSNSTTIRFGIGVLVGETGNTSGSITISEVQFESGSSAGAYVANENTSGPASSSFDTDITVTGLLVEEARTNICLQSEDFSTTWTPTRITVNTDQAIAPDGTLTADELVPSVDNDTHIVVQGVFDWSASNSCSIYAKAGAYDHLAIAGDSLAAFSSWFDLSAGTVGTNTGASVGSIEDVGNGWYRCTVTGIKDNSTSIIVYVANSETSSFAGDGTSSIFVWGAQLEAGSFPTSYIPTVAASVTRNLDDLSTSDVSWYNDTAGTFYAQAHKPQSSNGYIASINANSLSNQFVLYVSNNDSRVAHSTGAGDDGAVNFADNAWLVERTGRLVSAVAENDLVLYDEGTAGTPDTSVTVPTSGAFTKLEVGHATADTSPWNGHIAEIAYYNTRRVNATLDDMSTNGPGEGAEE